MNKLKRKNHKRTKCRKCGCELVNKEGYVLCGMCGWTPNKQKIKFQLKNHKLYKRERSKDERTMERVEE